VSLLPRERVSWALLILQSTNLALIHPRLLFSLILFSLILFSLILFSLILFSLILFSLILFSLILFEPGVQLSLIGMLGTSSPSMMNTVTYQCDI